MKIETIGANIKKYRTEKGIKQSELAEKTGVSANYIGILERGDKAPSLAMLVDIANMQPFEQVCLLKKLKPDVFIGVPTWASKLGIPTTHVLDMKRPTMGYDGILYLGNKIADQLENPGFNKKLSEHVKLPYKESWYQEDAFKYIIREGGN